MLSRRAVGATLINSCYFVTGLLLVLVLALTAIGLSGGRFNRTASHPIGIYWIVDKEPALGDYIQFCIPVDRANLPPIDTVYVTPCTGDYAGTPLLKRISKIDHHGLFYVEGDHPRSLDSRVFGPLKKSDILAVMWPVLTM